MSGGLRHRNDEEDGLEPCGWINESSWRNPSAYVTVRSSVSPHLQKAPPLILDSADVVRDVVIKAITPIEKFIN